MDSPIAKGQSAAGLRAASDHEADVRQLLERGQSESCPMENRPRLLPTNKNAVPNLVQTQRGIGKDAGSLCQ